MLNPKQEKFCLEYVQGKSAMSAYKTAYGTSNSGTAKVNGSKLLKNPAIQARLLELQSEVANEKICTAQEIQERLSAIARRELYETLSLPSGEQTQKQTPIRDSVRALELLAKINGMFIAKTEVDVKNSVPVVIVDDI